MANSNEPDIKMIVGLGNPGTQYDHTRHNMGVDLLNIIADKYRINMQLESRYFGIVGRGEIEGNEVRLVYPTTYMNESGRCVGAIANFFKIKPEEILVIHDDLDLLPGHMRLKLQVTTDLKALRPALETIKTFTVYELVLVNHHHMML